MGTIVSPKNILLTWGLLLFRMAERFRVSILKGSTQESLPLALTTLNLGVDSEGPLSRESPLRKTLGDSASLEGVPSRNLEDLPGKGLGFRI